MHIAIVNSYKISDKEYKAELYQLMQERKSKNVTLKLKELAINNLIDAILLKEESQKIDLPINEQEVQYQFIEIQNQYSSPDKFSVQMKKYSLTTDKLIEHIRNNIRVKQFIKFHFINKVKIEHNKISEYYEAHKHDFIIPEEIKICHILVKDDDLNSFQKIEEISKRLYNKDDFCEIAKEYSDCPSGKDGGNLGYIQRGKILKELEDVAFSLPIGQITGPIKTRFGYHFIKVMDKRKSRIPEFKEIKDALKKQLERIIGELELLKHIRKLRAEADIIINHEYL